MKAALGLACSCIFFSACALSPEKGGPSANVTLRPASGSKVTGRVSFTQIGERVRLEPRPPGPQK